MTKSLQRFAEDLESDSHYPLESEGSIPKNGFLAKYLKIYRKKGHFLQISDSSDSSLSSEKEKKARREEEEGRRDGGGRRRTEEGGRREDDAWWSIKVKKPKRNPMLTKKNLLKKSIPTSIIRLDLVEGAFSSRGQEEGGGEREKKEGRKEEERREEERRREDQEVNQALRRKEENERKKEEARRREEELRREEEWRKEEEWRMEEEGEGRRQEGGKVDEGVRRKEEESRRLEARRIEEEWRREEEGRKEEEGRREEGGGRRREEGGGRRDNVMIKSLENNYLGQMNGSLKVGNGKKGLSKKIDRKEEMNNIYYLKKKNSKTNLALPNRKKKSINSLAEMNSLLKTKNFDEFVTNQNTVPDSKI